MLYLLVAPVFFNLIIHGSCQLLKLIKFGLDIVKYLPHLQHLPARSIYYIKDLPDLIGSCSAFVHLKTAVLKHICSSFPVRNLKDAGHVLVLPKIGI